MSSAPLLIEYRTSNNLMGRYTFSDHGQKLKQQSTTALGNFIEEDNTKQKKTKVSIMNTLDPDSSYMVAWRIINLICIYIYFFELPIAIVFENTRDDRQHIGYLFEIINVPCILIFSFNMVIKMRLPFYKNGLLITDSKQILKNYFKFMFIFDIISLTIVTAYQIQEAINSQNNVQRVISKLNLLFYVKIFELWQINQVNRSVFQLHRKTLGVYNMIILIINILTISNMIACIFFSISQDSCGNHVVSPNLESCWVMQTVIGDIPIINQFWYVQYIYSLYWASTTMLGVGYGDIYPRNVNEVTFTIIAEYISCAIFAYSINEVWQIFKDMKQIQTKHQKQFNIINRYMRDKKVKNIVSNKVRAYLTYYYRFQRKGQKDKQQQIIDDLAPAIRQELYMDSFGCIFKFKLFQIFSQQLFQQLVHKVEQMRYSEGQIIQSPQYEELNPSINYIFKGEIISCIKVGNLNKQTHKIGEQFIFGQYEFITGQVTDTIVTTTTHCSIYILNRNYFKKQIQQKDFEYFYILVHSALYLNKLTNLHIQCCFCQSFQHISQYCSLMKIKGNYLTMFKNYRTYANSRSLFKRPSRRLVNKLVSKNQFGAVIKMIRKRIQQHDSNIQVQSGVNYSFNQIQPAGFDSFVDQNMFKSHQFRRGLSQVTQQNKNNKICRANSLNLNQSQLFEKNKILSARKSHYQFRQLLITEGMNIDEIKNYNYYFPRHNIVSIMKKANKRNT